MRALLLAAVLSACGPSDFPGHYAGTFHVAGTCANGQALEHSYQADWEVTQKGNRLTISTNGTCGVWTATASGDMAKVDAKECGESGGGGYLFWPTLAQAQVTCTETGLEAHGGFHDRANLSGEDTTCTTLLDAQLTRQ